MAHLLCQQKPQHPSGVLSLKVARKSGINTPEGNLFQTLFRAVLEYHVREQTGNTLSVLAKGHHAQSEKAGKNEIKRDEVVEESWKKQYQDSE
jgi:hypothetical protein